MINKDWHKKHPMPRKATFNQKIQWHVSHKRECADVEKYLKVLKRKCF